jgi:putative ABC transport system ATP-binding protein
MKDDELTIFRRRNIGFVYLVPVLNVEENILLPIQLLSLILLTAL